MLVVKGFYIIYGQIDKSYCNFLVCGYIFYVSLALTLLGTNGLLESSWVWFKVISTFSFAVLFSNHCIIYSLFWRTCPPPSPISAHLFTQAFVLLCESHVWMCHRLYLCDWNTYLFQIWGHVFWILCKSVILSDQLMNAGHT